MRTAQQVDEREYTESGETAIDRMAESIAKRLVRVIDEWSFEASEGPPFGVGVSVDAGTEEAGA